MNFLHIMNFFVLSLIIILQKVYSQPRSTTVIKNVVQAAELQIFGTYHVYFSLMNKGYTTI